jgi:hypothetical protein
MSFKDLPQSLIDAASKLMKDVEIFESSPPDPKIEKWILSNKERFKTQYGDDEGEKILYAKAWNMHNAKEACEQDDEMVKKHNAVRAQSGLPELGEVADDSAKVLDKDLDGVPGNTKSDEHDTEEDKEKERVAGPAGLRRMQMENYASPEPSSAVAFRSDYDAVKHADILLDSDEDHNNVHRLFVQYDNKYDIIPSPAVPGYKTLEELKACQMVTDLYDPSGEVLRAFEVAMTPPVEEPMFAGNDKKEEE